MTLLKPTLQVKRMIVSRRGGRAFDAEFHPGLNIIRGENSSGKSTLLDFLFYGLGGDLHEWREAALSCDQVTVEVLINGRKATLVREVSTAAGRPMRIFPGPLADATDSADGWAVYPYKRSPQKESFSQVLFRWLDMPEVVGDASSNITMHQMLRILYSDQLSPIDRLFRIERFDTALTRQTVGDLLCGAFDDRLYRDQIRLRDVDKEVDEVGAELRSIFSVLGHVEHSLTMEWVESERAVLREKIADVQRQILDLEERIFHGEVSDGLSLQDQQDAYADLQRLQLELGDIQRKRDELQLETADSDLFIKSLREKLSALDDAASASVALKRISFVYCPACFAPIDNTIGDHACHLCKAPFDQDRAQSRILTLINDISLQLKQSAALQAERLRELEVLDRRLAEHRNLWEGASHRYALVNRSPSTELRSKARQLHRQAGYLDRQLEDLNNKAGLVERVDNLSRRKADLTAEHSRLRDQIKAAEIFQQKQLASAYTRIADHVRALLRRDFARQDTFMKADHIAFSFSDDRISVNGESFFSASSMVFLKNAFMAAFLQSAMQDSKFRHPRFLILDTIEDKGMEPARSHNFQRILREISDASQAEHQLIYATAMIAPELEGTEYVVDRFFTHDDRTLRLGR